MVLSPDYLRPGTRLRFLRGHHPGSVCKVVRVQRQQVTLKGVSGAPARALRDPFTVTAAFLAANAEVLR